MVICNGHYFGVEAENMMKVYQKLSPSELKETIYGIFFTFSGRMPNTSTRKCAPSGACRDIQGPIICLSVSGEQPRVDWKTN
jgi:hypothetical protein